MSVSAEAIKELREKSGAGVMECKKALEQAQGDPAKAQEFLRLMSLATASKKAARATAHGRIEGYIHHGEGRIGVLVELKCESDFVAKSDEFKVLAKDLCLQVAASSPLAVHREQIPKDVLEFHQARFREELAQKPPQMLDKILAGKMVNFYKETVLMEQPFVKDPKVSVGDYLKSKIGILKENITVGRFVRLQLGE
ncbi:MAG: elongation factor Ts [Planctomycetes bacterium]|nr:elongation factor Ts [Planctomycetota bacterium]